MGRAARAPKVCTTHGCPHDQPCPTHHRPHRKGRRPGQTVTSGWAEQRRARRIIRRDHGLCLWCQQPGADEVDHIVPLWEGGADTDANLAPIHARPCHKAKSASEAARRAARRGGVPPRRP